jgi:hypothetical protein
MIEKITIEQLHDRFKAQGVTAREHIAFKCVICGTVQSMSSLIKAGCAVNDRTMTKTCPDCKAEVLSTSQPNRTTAAGDIFRDKLAELQNAGCKSLTIMQVVGLIGFAETEAALAATPAAGGEALQSALAE